jgi:hypothetical protein
MLIEATTLGHSQPEIFGEVGQRAVQQWIKALSEALRRDRAPESNVQRIATQAYATLVGLQVDLIATNDRPRVDKAFEELCSWIEAEAKDAVAAQ